MILNICTSQIFTKTAINLHKRQFCNGQVWLWPETVCWILSSFTLVQRKRKGCDWSLSLACLIGLLLVTLGVCVPPALYRRNGARWKLAGVYLFDFSPLALENDPPAGYFIPGRSSPLLLCNVRWCSLSYQSPAAAQRSVARICAILLRVGETIRQILPKTSSEWVGFIANSG